MLYSFIEIFRNR